MGFFLKFLIIVIGFFIYTHEEDNVKVFSLVKLFGDIDSNSDNYINFAEIKKAYKNTLSDYEVSTLK